MAIYPRIKKVLPVLSETIEKVQENSELCHMACSELRVLDDASLGASEVKNGSHRHLPGLSVRDHRLDKTPWQLVTS